MIGRTLPVIWAVLPARLIGVTAITAPLALTGRLHLTVDGETDTYEPGETYDIGAGEEHSARLEAGTCVIDVFQDPDRYSPK